MPLVMLDHDSLSHLCSFLTGHEVIQLAAVCRKLAPLQENPFIWKRCLSNEYIVLEEPFFETSSQDSKGSIWKKQYIYFHRKGPIILNPFMTIIYSEAPPFYDFSIAEHMLEEWSVYRTASGYDSNINVYIRLNRPMIITQIRYKRNNLGLCSSTLQNALIFSKSQVYKDARFTSWNDCTAESYEARLRRQDEEKEGFPIAALFDVNCTPLACIDCKPVISEEIVVKLINGDGSYSHIDCGNFLFFGFLGKSENCRLSA